MEAIAVPPPPKRTPGTSRTALVWFSAAVFPFLVVLPEVGGSPYTEPGLRSGGSTLAMVLLVPALRRRPLVALVMMLLGAAVVPPLAGNPGAIALLPFLAVDIAVGYLVATRTRTVCAVAVTLAFLTQLLMVPAFGGIGNNLVALGTVALLALATCCMVGLLSRERRTHQAALRSRELADAITAERLRIARELHDQVAHSIGIIAIQAGVGSRVIETQPLEAREALRAIEATSRETLSGLRRTLVALRRSAPAATAEGVPHSPAPGLADLERLAERTSDAGVRVDLRWSGRRRQLPPDIDLSAYRIVQEALTNVVRHAGVDRCRVEIGFEEEELSVEIVDEGRGMREAEPGAGFGITGMRERVALLYGAFSAGPRAEGGFRVAARLPLPDPVAVAAAPGTDTDTNTEAGAR
ncbi:sensor histidine kinase [Streptomyces antnestii]|uniref:sensor histidine kinase n=1 Tax=Streptomyces antnestii TaxID=2494256 RepID=UPI001CB989FA|nr:sensor histidine kinase [Streptomyces sp. San01]